VPAPLRVLVADDSPTACRALAAFLRAPEFEVVAAVHSGEAAVERTAALRPNAVTLDLQMPGLGGLGALDAIMAKCPTPVVLLTGVSGESVKQTVEGLARGAVDFLLKFAPGRDWDADTFGREVASKVRTAAGVKVVRSLPSRAISVAGVCDPGAVRTREAPASQRPATEWGDAPAVLVIGASTGGPVAVRELLSGLPRALAVLVVQHMPAGFTKGFAELLARQTGRAVREAEPGARLDAGAVLVAPGGAHVAVGSDLRLRPVPHATGVVYRPSIDVAMLSAARALGARVAGAVLTGMGDDGVRGLAAIRAAGGRTFAQNEETSVVFGMPQRAAEAGAAGAVDSPAGIAARISREFAW
jgi:two-component system, chemotaxis family, protein-glutamate methylesterase/glutaminase